MLCADLVDVEWRDKAGRSRQTVANLEDISISGACLHLDVAIPPHTTLRVSYPEGEWNGQVRYCVFREIGYFVGIEFDHGCQWSQRNFKPLHLLDLQRLVSR